MPGGGREAGPGGIFLQLPSEMAAHEYLRPQLTTRKEKTWSERLTYETGICYLTGLLGGGSFGAVDGWLKANKKAHFKLKINSVLNSSGRLGSRLGNGFACYALLFSVSKSLIKYQRRKNDIYNDIAGVTVAGTLCTLPRGGVPALGVGLALGSAASIMIYARTKAESKSRDDYIPLS